AMGGDYDGPTRQQGKCESLLTAVVEELGPLLQNKERIMVCRALAGTLRDIPAELEVTHRETLIAARCNLKLPIDTDRKLEYAIQADWVEKLTADAISQGVYKMLL